MPFSNSSQISTILGFMEEIQPKSILDVGVGFGIYGLLARINIEHFNLMEANGPDARQRERSEWKVRIDGIEGFPLYLTPAHDWAYNEIQVGDAMKLLPDIEINYDLILATDILEHFEKEDGYKFLNELKRIASKNILISTPKEFIKQEWESNPYENHRSLWTKEDLEECEFRKFFHNADNWIAVFTV